MGQWLRDEGHLTDKSRLPVIQLNFGGNSAPGDQDDPEGRARDRSHAARCVIENFHILEAVFVVNMFYQRLAEEITCGHV